MTCMSSDDVRILLYDIDSKQVHWALDWMGELVFVPSPNNPNVITTPKLVLWKLDRGGHTQDEKEPIGASALATE